jgi:hypothetical protein
MIRLFGSSYGALIRDMGITPVRENKRVASRGVYRTFTCVIVDMGNRRNRVFHKRQASEASGCDL